MDNRVLVAVVVIIIIGLGAFFLMSSNRGVQTPSPAPETLQPAASSPLSSDDSSSTTSSETGQVKEFTVEGSPFKFVPNSLTVNEGDTVRVTFKNVNGSHDFRIDEYNVATKQLTAGKEETVEFVANKKGSFEFYCSVGNHRAQGMKGTLVVQ